MLRSACKRTHGARRSLWETRHMKRRITKAAVALGAACLALAGLAPLAHASTVVVLPRAIEAYDVGGAASGIIATAAVRPSIFDPLAQAGNLYAEATLSSQADGTSASIAAQIFPGKFGIGAVGCAGLKGWVQAAYPEAGGCKEAQEDTLLAAGRSTIGAGLGAPQLDDVLNTFLDRTEVKAGNMRAEAHFGTSSATVTTQRYALLTAPGGPPAVEAVSMSVTADTYLSSEQRVGHKVRSAIKDLSILDGVLQIGSLVSTASTESTALMADAVAGLTFSDVTALVDGKQRRATIDGSGVHLNDPALNKDQNLGLTETFNDALLKAGITITVGSPTKIVDGTSADASVGGLLIAFHGTAPSVKVPDEVAPVVAQIIGQIPTSCLNDFGGPLPLCFGPGVLPGFGSEVVYSMVLGSAASHAIAFPAPVIVPDPGCVANCGSGGPGPIIGPIGDPNLPEFCCPEVPKGAPVQPSTGTVVQQGPLVGLVARLPAAVLLWLGAAFLVLAVGMAMGPSLRHARAN